MSCMQGRITEFKVGEPGHALSVACYTHAKCSVVRTIRSLPFGASALCIQYLEAGRRLTGRDQAEEHKRMLPCLSIGTFWCF